MGVEFLGLPRGPGREEPVPPLLQRPLEVGQWDGRSPHLGKVGQGGGGPGVLQSTLESADGMGGGGRWWHQAGL